MRLNRHNWMVWIGLLILLVTTVRAQDVTPTVDTATPEPEITTLTIWLPDVLMVTDNPEAAEAFADQTAAFVEGETDVVVNTRLRRVGDAGGIMSTLRSASAVAPGALPDLTLIRRQELVTAVRDGLVQSLEGQLPSSLLGGLETTLRLGQIADELYGLPYMLDMRHVVYLPDDDVDYESWSYGAVLERGDPLVFPAGRVAGINDMLYLQYIAAGGSLSRDGLLSLNPAALRTVLDFYGEALDAGLVDSSVLNYTTTGDYAAEFLAGDYPVGVFGSTDYLQLLESDRNLEAAPVPTVDGQPVAVLNGWMWVMVTSDPVQQQAAFRYLDWIMNTDRQVEYAQEVYMLPSRRAALSASLPRMVDETLFVTMLDNAILPLTESEGGTLARAMQNALAAILSGDITAEEAIETILEQESN